MSETAWQAVLDALEDEVAALERGSEDARLSPAWEVPAGLDPLPEALRSRAEALLERTRTCQRRLSGERDAVAAELAILNTRLTAAQRYQGD